MTWFLALLTVPLAILMIWAMEVSNHNALSASEQVRLDAVTLSLCHSRKAFLQSSIQKLNRSIQLIQWEMEAAAAACAIPAACPTAVRILRASAISAKVLMSSQDTESKIFAGLQTQRAAQLLQKNKLAIGMSDTGLLSIHPMILPGKSGLKRETLSPRLKNYESLFEIKWPQKLVPENDFEDRNTYTSSLRPFRRLAQLKNSQNPRPHGILRVVRTSQPIHQNYGVQSACSIRSDLGALRSLKVRRLK